MATSLSLNIQNLVNWLAYAPLSETLAIRTAIIARMTALSIEEDETPATTAQSKDVFTINVRDILNWIADADADDAVNLQSIRAIIEERWDPAGYA